MKSAFTKQTERIFSIKDYSSDILSRIILSGFIVAISTQAMGQQAPSSITTINEVPVKYNVAANGYGVRPEYPSANLFNLKFGIQNAVKDGVNNVITRFRVEGLTYKPIPSPGTTPYDNVILKRIANPKVSDLGKFTAFYQNNGGVTRGTVTLPNPGGTNSATIPANTFTNIGFSSDADGFITSILISYPVANVNSMTFGGTTYTASEFAAAFPLNALIATDAGGNPTQTIEVDPIDGKTIVVIPFIAIDNAGIKSTNTGTATINFTLVNMVPVAVNDANSTSEDTQVDGSVTGNDMLSGEGGNVWSLVGDNGGAVHGTVTMDAAGNYTYTPAADYYGSDVFNYKVCDVDDDCSTATVTISIDPINDVPVAVDDVYSTNEDTPVDGSVTDNDTPSGDGGNNWTLVGTDGGASHGTVTMDVAGNYTYTPAANYNGNDVFNYKLCDIDPDCSTANVTITIDLINDVPVAVDDVNSTNEDTPVYDSATGNDTPSGDGGNNWTLVGTDGGAAHGTVTMDAAGNYTYTPAANYNGTDVFNYKLCDVNSDCSSATVTITINGNTGWQTSGGILTTGPGYVVCGAKNGFLQRTSPIYAWNYTEPGIANNPNNFVLFIDDISIKSPATCNTTAPLNISAAQNLPATADAKEASDELTVKVLANPSTSAFKLNIKSSQAENVTLRITDLYGRTVKVINNAQSNTTLNVGEDLKPGNYFVEITQNSVRKVLKLVKL